MKTIAAIVLLSCSCCAFGQDKAAVSRAEAACGPRDVQFDVTADESQHPTPEPEKGKALIYMVQNPGISTRVGADGKWLGALKNRTYLAASIDPGEHHLCVIGRVGLWTLISLHELKAEAGETYYFAAPLLGATPDTGVFGLIQLDPDEGKYRVAKAKFATSHPK